MTRRDLIRVLIVEDEEQDYQYLKALVEDNLPSVCTFAPTVADAQTKLAKHQFTCILLDIFFVQEKAEHRHEPEGECLIADRSHNTPVIIVSIFADPVEKTIERGEFIPLT